MNPSLTDQLMAGLRAVGADMLIDGDQAVSRAAFESWVVAAVLQLRAQGVVPGTRLALHGVVSAPLVVTLVACLLEGVVVVPVDAELAGARKQLMLDLAAPAVVLDFSEQGLGLAWPRTVRCSDQRPTGMADLRLEAIELPVLADDAPCYVFFTSGTSGTPKGILGRRGGLAHFLAWEAGLLGLGESDRVSILTRLSFDVVLRDLLLPIVAGATGCIPPSGGRWGPGDVLRWLARMEITVTHAVPSLSQAYLAALPATYRNLALRHTLFAGEPLTGTLAARWRKAFPASAVYNLYGPTETTLAKVCARVPDPAPEGILACGQPLPQASLLILDEALAPLAAHELGEVVIRTRHQSLGYLDSAEPAARNFLLIDGQPAYRTGDLGFLDETGALHLRGRKDHQVKIHGVRIEPIGVAALLQTHPAVREAAVVCIKDEAGGPVLLAYVTSDEWADTLQDRLPKRLRPFLAERLPAAAVPSHFIVLDALPVTPNGKLDHARLPPPSATAPFEAPADDAERVIAEAIATVLGQTQVSAADDFFALGGDSLAAAELCLALEDQMQWHLQPAMLLRAPTARDLAVLVRSSGAVAQPPIPAAPRVRFFALSPQQKRYFRTFCAGGNRSWCNMVAVFDLPDGVGSYRVHQALVETALRHTSLRLRFSHDEQGGVVQSIAPSDDFPLQALDLTAVAPADLPTRISALRVAEAECEIPVFGEGPLFRAALMGLPDGRRKLLWNVHHLVSDGSSQGLLAAELLARLDGRPPAEPAPPNFRDIAAWAQQRPGLDQARQYFRELLRPRYEPAWLPERIACADACPDTQRCHAFEAALSGLLRERVRAAARRLKCTPYVLFVSAYYRLLAAQTGRDDLVIVTPLAGRGHPQIAPAIGDFINLVPMRVSGLGRMPASELLEQVRAGIAAAAAHQAWQFDEILDDLGIPFDADRNPLTGFSLNYMPHNGAALSAPAGHADRGYKLKYDLLFLIRDFSDRSVIEIQCRAGLLAAHEVGSLFTTYCRHLEDMSHD